MTPSSGATLENTDLLRYKLDQMVKELQHHHRAFSLHYTVQWSTAQTEAGRKSFMCFAFTCLPSNPRAEIQLGVGWGRAGCPCPTPNKPCLSPHPPERDPGSRQFLPGPNHLSSPGLGHCFQCPSSFVCLESPLSLQGLAEISLPAGSPLSGVHRMCRWVRLALAFLKPLL